MRITNVTWLFPRLTETFIAFPLVQLEWRGHSLKMFAAKDPRRDPAMEDLVPEAHVHASLEGSHLLRNTVYLPEQSALYRALQQDTSEVLLFHWGDYIHAMLSWPPLGRPVLMCCHEPDFSQHFLPTFRDRPREVLERLTAITVETEAQRSDLLQIGFPPQRVFVWQAGIDIAAIDAAIGSAYAQEIHQPVRLVSAGRFVPKKGFLQAIEAIHLLHESGKQVHYRLIGEGVLLPAIEDAIRDFGLQGCIQVEGKQAHPGLYHAFATADMFLAPSHGVEGDREGIMTTVLEAMACHVPVLSTRHGGTPEIVEHGQTGYLLADNSPQEIADGIIHLQRDPVLWHKLRDDGAAYVRSTHNLQRRVDQLESLLFQISTFPYLNTFLPHYPC